MISLIVVGGSALPAQNINPRWLVAHASFLASDALEGRAPGRGATIAARYIEAQFLRLGLRPAAGTGFLQRVPLTRLDVVAPETRIVVSGSASADTIGESEFHFLGGDASSYRSFAGRAEFVGTMQSVVATASGQRLAGRVAIMTGPGDLEKAVAMLVSRGAEGAIIVAGNPRAYAGLRNARSLSRFYVREKIAGLFGSPLPVLVASPAAGDRIKGVRTEDSAVVAINVSSVAREQDVDAWNVAALIPGTDTSLRGEHVILLAHYDHIGYARPEGDDSLYNGFIDNAVGTAAVLGAAEAMVASRPRRSVLFLLTTAEEPGSLGSAFYVEHPLLPLHGLRAAINLDAGAPLAPPLTWILEGADSATVRVARRVARTRGWTVAAAPAQPNSDHWSFLRKQVPALMLVPGERWQGTSSEQQDALIARWWRAHRPGDEWSSEFPVAGLVRYAEFAKLLTQQLADGRE